MTEMDRYAVECENLSRVYRSGSIIGRGREVEALVDLSIKVSTEHRCSACWDQTGRARLRR